MSSSALLLNGTGVLETPKDRYFYFGYTMMAIIALIFAVVIVIVMYDTYKVIRGKIRSRLSRNKNQNSPLSLMAESDQKGH